MNSVAYDVLDKCTKRSYPCILDHKRHSATLLSEEGYWACGGYSRLPTTPLRADI